MNTLKAHRERLFLTQVELADKSEVSLPTIKRLEAGKTGATFGTLRKLANALNIGLGELASLHHPQPEEVRDDRS